MKENFVCINGIHNAALSFHACSAQGVLNYVTLTVLKLVQWISYANRPSYNNKMLVKVITTVCLACFSGSQYKFRTVALCYLSLDDYFYYIIIIIIMPSVL